MMEVTVLLMKASCFRCQNRSTEFQQKRTEFMISPKERYGNKAISEMYLILPQPQKCILQQYSYSVLIQSQDVWFSGK